MESVSKTVIDDYIHKQSSYKSYDSNLETFLLENGLVKYDERDPKSYVYYKIVDIKKWVFCKLKYAL